MWYSSLIILAIGLVVLTKGSDYFVEAAARIARQFGVSKFLIGLSLVAFGTSIPELVSSIIAAIEGHSGLVVGNVIGSNIANIGLVIGLAAIIGLIRTDRPTLKLNGYIMLFATLLFPIFAFNGVVSTFEAFILLISYIAYIVFLFRFDRQSRDVNQTKGQNCVSFWPGVLKDLLILFGSGCAIVFGGHLLVKEAVWFAFFLGVPESIIGLSMVAVGTSLPELGVSISAVRKGYGGMLIGNIIGSNIANILLVVGVSSMIAPLHVMPLTLFYLVPFMIFISLLLLLFIKNNWDIGKMAGVSILLLYTVFIFIVFRFKLA